LQALEDRRVFAADPLTPVAVGPSDWLMGQVSFQANVPASVDGASYTLSLESGNLLSMAVDVGTTGTPVFTLTDPAGHVARTISGQSGQSALLRNFAINQTGTWTITVFAQLQAGTVPVRVAIDGDLEVIDSTSGQKQNIGGSWLTTYGTHYAVQGRTQLVNGVDVDEYTIDLSSRVGQQFDVIVRGLNGASYTGQTLEVVAPNGTTVLRTGGGAPGLWSGTTFDLGVLNFRVPMAGTYTFRLTSNVAGNYLLAVTEGLPQEAMTARQKLDLLVSGGETTLASTNQLLARLPFQYVHESLTTDELLAVLIEESIVQGYKDVSSLKAALPSFGIDLTELRPDGVLTALELAWNGSLLRSATGQALTSPVVKNMLKTLYASDPGAVLDRLSTLHLLELLDDHISTSASDDDFDFVAYTRRDIIAPIDNVLGTARAQMLLNNGTFGPLPSGAAAAAAINLMPVGHRVLYVRDFHYVEGFEDFHIDRYDENGQQYDYYMLWMDEWEKIVQQRYETFFQEFHAAGGQVDVVMIDFEMKSLSHWEAQGDRRVDRNSTPAQGFWETVTADPRWNEIRERLLKVGFTPAQLTPAALQSWSSRDDREARWNAVMEERYYEYFKRAMMDPIHAIFPNAMIANYGEGYRTHTQPYGSFTRLRSSYYTVGRLTGDYQTPVLYASAGVVTTPTGDIRPLTDPRIEIDTISNAHIMENGVRTGRATVTVNLRSPATGMLVGDLFRIYNNGSQWIDPAYEGQFAIEWISGDLKQIKYTITLPDVDHPPSAADLTARVNTTNTAFFAVFTSYNGLVGDVMELRSNVAASSAPLLPWISSPQYQAVRNDLLYEHYGEGIFHAALSGAEGFQLWKWSGFGQDPTTDIMVSNLLSELDEMIGFADRRTLSFNEVSWGDGYILTGMEAGGRRVWRLTPDPSLSFQQIPGYGARFQIGNKTVEIPDGYVYTPTQSNSDLGIWIVQDSVRSYLKHSAAALAAMLNAPSGSAGTNGTAGNDVISITAVGNEFRVMINGNLQTYDAATTGTLVIDGGAGNDVITVNAGSGTLPASLTILGGEGNDTLNLTSGASINGGLRAVAGSVLFRGGAGQDTLRLVDTNNAGNSTTFLYATAVFGLGMTGIAAYNDAGVDIENLQLDLGSGHDLIGIAGLSAATTINGGAGNEFVTVEPAFSRPLTYNAGDGYDWLSPVFFAGGDDQVQITGQSLSAAQSVINYTQLDVIDLYTMAGIDTVTIFHNNSIADLPGIIRYTGGTGSASGVEDDALVIQGSTDHDVMSVSDFPSNLPGRYQLAQVEALIILAGLGNDYISNTSSVTSLIDGGAGNDYIMGGSATDIIFGGEGVDALFGNDGSDYLSADANRHGEIFIASGDRVEGGNGNDRAAVLGVDRTSSIEQLVSDATLLSLPQIQKLRLRAGNGP
jgi:Ca2+-binding RTX toxin-like protein